MGGSKKALQWLILLCLPFLFVGFIELAMALAGMPTENKKQLVHPPSYSAHRSNIEFEYQFETNGLGLRDRKVRSPKPKNQRRILVLGDSFVEGVGVELGERFTEHLEKRLTTEEIEARLVNMGLAGQGPLQYGRVLTGVGVNLEPDGLMVCVYANDLSNTSPRFKGEQIYPESTLPRSGWRASVHSVIPRIFTLLGKARRAYSTKKNPKEFESAIISEAKRSHIDQAKIDAWKRALPRDLVAEVNAGRLNGAVLGMGLIRPRYWKDAIEVSGSDASKRWKAMRSVLEEIFKVARKRSLPAALVFIPSRLQYDAHFYDPNWSHPMKTVGMQTDPAWLEGQSEISKRLQALAESNHAAYLDMSDALRSEIIEDRGIIYPIDGHWTAKGHEAAARIIEDWIRDRGVFGFELKAEG